MVSGPALLSAVEASVRMDRGELAPTDLVEANLAQIEALDPKLHAFISVHAEEARQDARRLTDEIQRRGRRSPLHGITVAVKDVIDVAGMRTTGGTRAGQYAAPASRDADVVARLRAAGAIMLGKTSTPAYAAYAHTTNAIVGTTVSPWDESLSAGGSSGGSAVAVATGMCTLSIGSDLGGSVRGPSAWAGIFGLRPTAGRVSNAPHGWVDDTIDVVGAMTRDPRDLGLWLSVVEACIPVAPFDIDDTKPIAYSVDLAGELAIDDDIRKGFIAAIDAMRDAGIRLVEKSPETRDAVAAIRPLRALRALALYADANPDTIREDNTNLADFLECARSLSGPELAAGASLRTKAWQTNERFFEGISAFLMPTAQFSGVQSDRVSPDTVGGLKVSDPLTCWYSTYIVSMLGWPVVAMPSGQTVTGRPLGLQLIGPRGSDAPLIAFAGALSRRLGWGWKMPSLLEGLL